MGLPLLRLLPPPCPWVSLEGLVAKAGEERHRALSLRGSLAAERFISSRLGKQRESTDGGSGACAASREARRGLGMGDLQGWERWFQDPRRGRGAMLTAPSRPQVQTSKGNVK